MNNVDKVARLSGGEEKEKGSERFQLQKISGKNGQDSQEKEGKEIDTFRTKNFATLRRRAARQHYRVPTNISCLYANLSLTKLSRAVIISSYN